MNHSNTKYFYCFRGTLSSHVHFFRALQTICVKHNLNLKLITFLNPKVYLSQGSLVKEFKSESFKIIISPFLFVVPFLYFFFAILFSKKTIIHLKKRDPKLFLFLKFIFKSKLILVTDLEGDLISENDYLFRKEHKSESILHEENQLSVSEEFDRFSVYDFIFVRNEYFEKLLRKRHPALKTIIKTSDLMSFKKGTLSFDNLLRNNFRIKLGWDNSHIITYIGNVYYPWQNLSKTIRIFKKIKKKSQKDTKLLLLIRKADHILAEKFITRHKLNKNDYVLQEVPHYDMKGYLCASDIGVVIRDLHEMNRVVTAGKLLDYLACGLPVITTSVFENVSEHIKNNNYGLVLQNLNIEELQFNKVQDILNLDTHKKIEISNWANNNLSLDVTSLSYIEILKNFDS